MEIFGVEFRVEIQMNLVLIGRLMALVKVQYHLIHQLQLLILNISGRIIKQFDLYHKCEEIIYYLVYSL